MVDPIEAVPTAVVGAPTEDVAGHPFEVSALEWLRPLLSAAGQLDLDDRDAAARLHRRAAATTAALAAEGVLPAPLVVGRHDPPVVVVRLLARAWRHVSGPGGARARRVVTPAAGRDPGRYDAASASTRLSGPANGRWPRNSQPVSASQPWPSSTLYTSPPVSR